MSKCINFNLSNEGQRQRDIVKKMLEKKTPGAVLGSFIKALSKNSEEGEKLWSAFLDFDPIELEIALREELFEKEQHEYEQSKYVHKSSTPLLTLDDFNRSELSSKERKRIKEEIKHNIVSRCLFDLDGNTGTIHPLEKINENILAYKLSVMLDLAEKLYIDTPITSIDDLLYAPENNGEELLQNLFIEIQIAYNANGSSKSEDLIHKYNLLTYFDTILLSTFENVIGFDPEYANDGFVYLHKYVYLGPGTNMRKGHQDNKSEGFADAFENMANITKMITNFIPKYMSLSSDAEPMGYIGDKMAVFLFAELWEFVVDTYRDPSFYSLASKNPNVFVAINMAIDNPADADWGAIVKHYINTKTAFAKINIRECMIGLYKHIFQKGQGTWLYEDFVSCIQKYRKTSYQIISNVRKNKHKYLEFNELSLWTEQNANFKLQDQLSYSTVAFHAKYDTDEKRQKLAKELGLKVINQNTFSVKVDGIDVVISVVKDGDKVSFEMKTNGASREAILNFLLTKMNVNIAKDALIHLQSELHGDDIGKRPGEIRVSSIKSVANNAYFESAIAPVFGLWVNSVFDKKIELEDKTTFTPSLIFDSKYFAGEKVGVNDFSPYYSQLYRMSEILQIVHNENTSNVIKNGKGNNVPVTQLATIQQDGPVLDITTKKAERKKIEENKRWIEQEGIKDKVVTRSFKSVSQHNPTLSQRGFCTEKSWLNAGVVAGPVAKESKELKGGELIHDELIYMFVQQFFEGGTHIYTQPTANADKNLQNLKGLALDLEIEYADSLGVMQKQNDTLRSIIKAAMNGDDSKVHEYYALHNAKALLALEHNICHSYNCAFAKHPDWKPVKTIDELATQLIKNRWKYLQSKTGDDWTLSFVKNSFRKAKLDFNESTFGVTAKVKGSVEKRIEPFDCVQFPKDMIRDFQIARSAVSGDFSLLEKQSRMYEKFFIQDIIAEQCHIDTITDLYFKELVGKEESLKQWVTRSGDLILATFEHNGRIVRLTSYSSPTEIEAFKNAENVTINPLLHAYHVTQFSVNAQVNEAYNGTRFSITAKKDDGVWIDSVDYCNVISTADHNIVIHGSDDVETRKKKLEIIEKVKARKAEIAKEWEKNYLKVENLRMVDYYKRATVNGTREHRILHGGKYNIPEEVDYVVFEDPEGDAILNSTASVRCKAQDGSIWVTPWHALQIDAGAGEAKLPPGVRKTMYHDIDPVTGGASLLKMAEFPITNEMRRLSQDDAMNMENLLMKLASRKKIVGLTSKKDIFTSIENLNSFFSGQTFYEQQKYNLSADDFGDYYAFNIQVAVSDDGKLMITKEKTKVTKTGEVCGNTTTKTYEVNTVYQIDRILGGCYSCDMTKTGLKLGESQNKVVNRIICELDLKRNYSAYAVNKESLKNNIKNVNPASEWYNSEIKYRDAIENLGEESDLWTSTISTKFGGIILNALHEMDEDVDVARGVQMLSEMIQNGNQYGEVENIYSNVRAGIQDALKDYTEALDTDDSVKLQDLIFDTIIDSITNSKDKTKVSLAQEFVLGIDAARKQKGIKITGFPISDKALYELLITSIVGKINKEGIRARNAGFGGVKHPSFGVAKIYDFWVPDGKDRDGNVKYKKIYAKHNDILNQIISFRQSKEGKAYSTWSVQDLMGVMEKDGVLNPFIERTKSSIFDVDLGETIVYKNSEGKWASFEITSDRDYQFFKRSIEPKLTEFYRNVFTGRRLRGYRTECSYTDESGNIKHDMMFNTDSRYLLSSIDYVRDAVTKIDKFIRDNKLNISIVDFIDTELFKNNCKKLTGYAFRDNYTRNDLKSRIIFIQRYFQNNDTFKKFFFTVTGKSFDDWFKQRYNNNPDYSVDEWEILNLSRFGNIFEGTPEEEVYDFTGWTEQEKKQKKEREKAINLFKNTLTKFIENQRLIGVSKFTDDGIFEFTKEGDTKPTQFVIKHSKIRKAEYMKSKGNVSKQFLIDRDHSMFDIETKGWKYFKEQLEKAYQQPTDSKLLYDVVIYDKARVPIYIKYDPNHLFAKYFSEQNGEYVSTINGIFREKQGRVYYKNQEVCSSNKMTSWIKHGSNGEKYTVLTIFDKTVFDDIVKGKYGKNVGFVSKVVPNLNEDWDESGKISLNYQDKQTWVENRIQREQETGTEIGGALANLGVIDGNRLWETEGRRRVAKLKHDLFISDLVDDNIIESSWEDGTDAFDNWLNHEAKKMWESFKKQKSAIGTRIPSQAMQSMMAMECVGYLDADYNEEMASIEMTYIQGSDYDIDKDYITEYFIDETGFVGDGSKLQQITALEEHVDQLPTPNGSEKEGVKYMKFTNPLFWKENDKIFKVDYSDVKEILDWLNDPYAGRNDRLFTYFLDILDAVNNGKKISISLLGDVADTIKYLNSRDYANFIDFIEQRYNNDDLINIVKGWFDKPDLKGNRAIKINRFDSNYESLHYFISEFVNWSRNHNVKIAEPLKEYPNYLGLLRRIAKYINMHQTSVISTSKDSQNISLSKELKILSNPKNIAAMEVSVDLSLSELKEFANERGVQSETGLSVWSPASKFKAQDTNLLGKTGVGVAANADKVYFTVYYYHTKILNDIAKIGNSKTNLTIEEQADVITKLSKTLIVNPFDEDDIRCISKLNWKILDQVPDFNISAAFAKSSLGKNQKEWVSTAIDRAVEWYNKKTSPSISVDTITFHQFLAYLKTIGKDVDGPTLLSALVSAATDNAKELVLSKLNAFGDILDAYGMCASLGIPFEDTAAIFTSPLLNVCVKEIRGDIHDPTNFVSKLEGSFGLYFADFSNPKKFTRINSILTSATIANFAKTRELGFTGTLNFKSPSGRLLQINELESANASIDDMIVKVKTEIDETYGHIFSSFDSDDVDDYEWEYILEAEMEAFDETSMQSTVTWKDAKPIQKMAFLSFLKKIKLRNNAIMAELMKPNGTTNVEKQLKDLTNISEKLMPKLYEQQILHKLLGVTKGIEGKPQQLYRYIRELEYFVDKKYSDAEIKEKFDFVSFFKDPEYAKKHIELYEGVREFTNILECLYVNEYIGEMLKTVGDTNELLTRVSFVYGNTQRLAKTIEENLGLHRSLNHKEYGAIAGMVNEWMIYQFLTYHGSHLGIRLNTDPERGEQIYRGSVGRNLEPADSRLHVNSMVDIMSFKHLANMHFFSDLMQDYAENPTKFYVDGSPNMFLEAIIPGGYLRVIPKNERDSGSFAKAVPEMVWKIAYNLNEDISDESSEYALQLKRHFEEIFTKPLRYKDNNGNWVERGITIGDFIYLYNLVVYQNSGTRNSFTKLFENAESLRKKSTLLPQFNAFVAALDSGLRSYDFVKDSSFIESIYLKLAAMKNSKLTDVIRKKKSSISVTFPINPDYPFSFSDNAIVPDRDSDAMAKFYDQMTRIVTQNTIDKTSVSMDDPGIYYVQSSMLPSDPTLFLKEHGDNFVFVDVKLYEKQFKAELAEKSDKDPEEIIVSENELFRYIKNQIKDIAKNKYVIITDPRLFKSVVTGIGLSQYVKKAFTHSEQELSNDGLAKLIENFTIRLPFNSNFLTILENTFSKTIQRVRPIILQDAVRKLWNSSGLSENGYNFGEYVKFVTSDEVGGYRDHRRFAKAWFEYSKDGKMTVYINIDNCDNERVLLHEMAHVLLIMNKQVNIDRYHEIANSFLQGVYPDIFAEKWNDFKESYPATVWNEETGQFEKLTDDLLFDEFLIDAISKQDIQDWNLDRFVQELIIHSDDHAMYEKKVHASQTISKLIESGELEIKCE